MADAARPVLGPEPPPAELPPPAAPQAARPADAEGAAEAKGMADMALFWGDGDEVDPNSADMAALLALQEECTPEERAEAYKARVARCCCRARAPCA
jgi:hypothetical protein